MSPSIACRFRIAFELYSNRNDKYDASVMSTLMQIALSLLLLLLLLLLLFRRDRVWLVGGEIHCLNFAEEY